MLFHAHRGQIAVREVGMRRRRTSTATAALVLRSAWLSRLEASILVRLGLNRRTAESTVRRQRLVAVLRDLGRPHRAIAFIAYLPTRQGRGHKDVLVAEARLLVGLLGSCGCFVGREIVCRHKVSITLLQILL